MTRPTIFRFSFRYSAFDGFGLFNDRSSLATGDRRRDRRPARRGRRLRNWRRSRRLA